MWKKSRKWRLNYHWKQTCQWKLQTTDFSHSLWQRTSHSKFYICFNPLSPIICLLLIIYCIYSFLRRKFFFSLLSHSQPLEYLHSWCPRSCFNCIILFTLWTKCLKFELGDQIFSYSICLYVIFWLQYCRWLCDCSSWQMNIVICFLIKRSTLRVCWER